MKYIEVTQLVITRIPSPKPEAPPQYVVHKVPISIVIEHIGGLSKVTVPSEKVKGPEGAPAEIEGTAIHVDGEVILVAKTREEIKDMIAKEIEAASAGMAEILNRLRKNRDIVQESKPSEAVQEEVKEDTAKNS